MNFKRGRPKNARAGCLGCKPWKVNGASQAMKDTPSDSRRKLAFDPRFEGEEDDELPPPWALWVDADGNEASYGPQ